MIDLTAKIMLCDDLALDYADRTYEAWKRKLDAAQEAIIQFVTKRLKSHVAGEFGGYLEGSYNICLIVKVSAKPTYVIRFPKPGRTAVCFIEEKVRNEIQIVSLLREKTTIPLPTIYTWGMTDDSPSQIGPFIIMEYIEGRRLMEALKQPTETKVGEVDLWKDLGNSRVLHAYTQIADYLLQIYQLDFNAAGAISRSHTRDWVVTERPLTDHMNSLATDVSNYPTQLFPTSCCSSPRMYFQQLADQHLNHLHTHRNAVGNLEDARRYFIARHRLKQSIDRFLYTNNNTSPFKIYCYDFRPSNMIVDEDLNIKAVVGFEFWNALPAQFAHGPPWWLTSLRPDEWIDRGFDFEALKSRLEPHVEQFLQVMEKVEKEKATDEPVALLSVPMRDSWISGRFWFNLAMDDSWTIDAVYWAALHKPGDEVLDEAMEDELKAFYHVKMKQLEAFNVECRERGI